MKHTESTGAGTNSALACFSEIRSASCHRYINSAIFWTLIELSRLDCFRTSSGAASGLYTGLTGVFEPHTRKHEQFDMDNRAILRADRVYRGPARHCAQAV